MMMDGKGKLEEKDCGESERGITRVIGDMEDENGE